MNKEEKKAIEDMNSFANGIDMSCVTARQLQIVLNLIEKLQNENEKLKQERNNNYRMIALAQNEVLGYMQGYEDGKKLKRSAVACIVENQQYYIIQKQFEHYKKYIEKLQKENEELKEEKEQAWEEWNNLEQGSYETEQKLKQQIKELQKENEELNLKYRMLYAGKFENMKAQEIKIRSQVIPVQKVKDKIEELEEEKKYYYSQYKIEELNDKIQVLQELIEEREEK
jgi:hypothetical protein